MEDQLQPIELRRTFAKNLKDRRKECGLTQAQLALRIGAHQPYVAALERAAQGVTLDTIAKIAEALGTTPEALLSGGGIFSSASA